MEEGRKSLPRLKIKRSATAGGRVATAKRREKRGDGEDAGGAGNEGRRKLLL